MTRAVVLALCMTGAAAGVARAQSIPELVEAGVRAYGNLDFEAAAGLLRRALQDAGRDLDSSTRTRGLTYLGAAEVFRANPDSAQAVFARLVRFDPRHRIDRLVFPPEVTDIFYAARRSTRAIAVVVADSSAFRIGETGFTPWIHASAFHDVRATLQRLDGGTARTLYAGPVGDSVRMEWDGATEDGAVPDPGRYFLSVESLDRAGAVFRLVRVPLIIEVDRRDSVALPGPLPDSLLLGERLRSGPGIEALGGLLMGVGVVALSSGLASGSDLSESRLVIGGSLSVAGIIGFLRKRPGRPIPANITHNDSVRAAWRDRLAAVARENEQRRSDVRIRIRASVPEVIESRQ